MNEEQEEASSLNDLAWDLVHQLLPQQDELRIELCADAGPGIVLDFGVETAGSLAAGLALAEVCTSGLASFSIVPGTLAGCGWPVLSVQTDNAIEACLFSQYAGWKLATENYFAMASGPMRASAGQEDLFHRLEYQEAGFGVVGVLESDKVPTEDVVRHIAQTCGVSPEHVALLVAPTASVAGNLQVVGRSVETAMHKLYQLGFDVTRVESACGWAPLSPVAADDLTAIGRSNDAILYGGRVTLWVNGDDESIQRLGPQVPACGSPSYGQTFLRLFEEAGRDFYKMDPLLFSPGEVVFQNVETGRVHQFGKVDENLLRASFEF